MFPQLGDMTVHLNLESQTSAYDLCCNQSISAFSVNRFVVWYCDTCRVRTGVRLLHLPVNALSTLSLGKIHPAFAFRVSAAKLISAVTPHPPGWMAAHQDPLSAADVIKLLTLSQ